MSELTSDQLVEQIARVKAVRLMGSCRNGCERDGGRHYHALPVDTSVRALCGIKPGRRSAGWADYIDAVRPIEAVTCPRCLKVLGSVKP